MKKNIFENDLMSEVEDGELVFVKIVLSKKEGSCESPKKKSSFWHKCCFSLIRKKMYNYEIAFFYNNQEKTNFQKINYKPYFYEFYPAEDQCDQLYSFFKKYENTWVKMKIFSPNSKFNNFSESISIKGKTLFSASPIKLERKFLVFSEESQKEEASQKLLKI